MNTNGPSANSLAQLQTLQAAASAALASYLSTLTTQGGLVAAAEAAVLSARAARQNYETGIWRNNSSGASVLDEGYEASVAGQAWLAANEWNLSEELPPSAAQIAQLAQLRATESAAVAAKNVAVATAQAAILAAQLAYDQARFEASAFAGAIWARGVSAPNSLDEGAGRADVYQ